MNWVFQNWIWTPELIIYFFLACEKIEMRFMSQTQSQYVQHKCSFHAECGCVFGQQHRKFVSFMLIIAMLHRAIALYGSDSTYACKWHTHSLIPQRKPNWKQWEKKYSSVQRKICAEYCNKSVIWIFDTTLGAPSAVRFWCVCIAIHASYKRTIAHHRLSLS